MLLLTIFVRSQSYNSDAKRLFVQKTPKHYRKLCSNRKDSIWEKWNSPKTAFWPFWAIFGCFSYPSYTILMPLQKQDRSMIWNECRNFRLNGFDVFWKTLTSKIKKVLNWPLPGHFGATFGFVSSISAIRLCFAHRGLWYGVEALLKNFCQYLRKLKNLKICFFGHLGDTFGYLCQIPVIQFWCQTTLCTKDSKTL